jgi:hypothetical protein
MNYTTLKSSVADFLNRQDLAAVIPTFISLSEANLNRVLRTRAMLCRATALLDTHFTKLPSDFLEAKNIQLNTDPVTSLQYVTIEHADLLRARWSTGKPRYYTIVGDTLEVVPPPDTGYTVELVYYKQIPALTELNETNWLLTSHPDVYLYGTLLQSAPYLKDDERIPIWGQLYKQFVADVQYSSESSEVSGSRLVMRASL